MSGVLYIVCTSVGRQILLSHLDNHPNIPVAGIINLNRDKAISKANYDSLYDIAKDNAIDIQYCENVNSKESLAFIKDRQPYLIIQSGWSQKFGSILLSIPKFGCIGEHPSPIPIGRGAACVNWALIENRKCWGDSFFKMVTKYDAGPVYAQKSIQINFYDDVRSIYNKIGFSSYLIVKENLQCWYNGVFTSIKLDENKATYYKRRKSEDGKLNFNWENIKIYNYVRALTKPYPGAYFMLDDKKVIVWSATLLDNKTDASPGTMFINDNSQSLDVATGNNTLIRLNRLQIAKFPEFFGNEFFLISKLIEIN